MKSLLTTAVLLYFSLQLVAQQKPLFAVSIASDADSEATLAEIRELILEKYYYDGITNNDLDWASIEGILRHISPPESPELARLWTDEEYENILNSLKGVKVTLGFTSTFNSQDGSLTVNSFTKDSEAEKKLKINDRIVRIDNESLKGKDLSEVNKILTGELNQKSTLKVVRDIQVFDVTLTRDSLRVENLLVSEIPSRSAALIELKKIILGMAKDLEEILQDLQLRGINNIVLDLRNNSGGVLNEGVNISRLFMQERDNVLRTQSRSNGILNYIAETDQFHELKMAVLINENTASAAEIIASALQDQNRAVLIGKRTFGKGVIETTFTLKNDYRLKFITSAMYSPKGNSWQAKGILPDYFIDQSAANYKDVSQMSIDDRMRNDLHLSTAMKLLK